MIVICNIIFIAVYSKASFLELCTISILIPLKGIEYIIVKSTDKRNTNGLTEKDLCIQIDLISPKWIEHNIFLLVNLLILNFYCFINKKLALSVNCILDKKILIETRVEQSYRLNELYYDVKLLWRKLIDIKYTYIII